MNKLPFRNPFYHPFLFLFIFWFVFPAALLLGQIPAEIDYSRGINEGVSSVAIHWSSQDEQKWKADNEGRLDIMGVKTSIHAEDLPTVKEKQARYQFKIDESCSIALLINVSRFFPGEEIALVDIHTQKEIFRFTEEQKLHFLTPSFDPSTTALVWSCPTGSGYQSRFQIQNVYVERVEAGRGRAIGFGTALACHPNAACKPDSLLKLISNSAVRIRMVMEEGIGWCSGSLVNNTRNDKTPYLLTAYHCQFEFTPLYDMWRFDFNYTSDSCANPAVEPQFSSLTGCEKVSSGQASDFLLVLLDQQIPANQQATFAGWNRDEAAIPDTSYLVHHPNADIRKFSTCSDLAVIHPSQIGWSEGYTTPANHHFRIKFTEGGHQAGSSGGPVFSEKGYMVGQLHGGVSGCEDQNTAFVGRFAKSWNLGPTPQERLKDWLDPDQTGLIQIPSIENIPASDIVDIRGVIRDPFGKLVKNAVVKVSGGTEQTLTTGSDGSFLISGINRNGQYTITPEKTDNPTNGLNVLDLVAIQKHLLAKDTFDFPWQYIASDATNNGQTSVGDIVLLLKLMLGKIMTLPSSPSWRFDPPMQTISSIPAGSSPEIQFTAIKIGDVNGTSDPQK